LNLSREEMLMDQTPVAGCLCGAIEQYPLTRPIKA
jgi:hypothetical protein